MKVSKNSWHYRFLRFLNRNPSENLCWYFWQVVLNLMFLAMLIPFLLFMAFVGLFLLSMPVLAWVLSWQDPANLFLLSFLSVIFWMAIGAKTIEFVREHGIGMDSVFGKSLIPEAPVIRKEGTFLDVAYQWFKAKKEKVCPRLEFVDEE